MSEDGLYDFLDNIEITEDGFSFEKDISDIDLNRDFYKLIDNILLTLNNKLFSKNYLDNSSKNNTSSFKLDVGNEICFIYLSYMVNKEINVLFAKIDSLDFIIVQHVTSCDFVYFPSINYLHRTATFDLNTGINVIRSLANIPNLKKIYKMAKSREFQLEGVILSHGRPYHFFYETATMAHKLYEKNLLNTYSQYQLVGCDFIDFVKLYKLNVSNHLVSPDYLNTISQKNHAIFFKVGMAFNKSDPEIIAITKRFETHLVSSIGILDESKSLYHKIRQFKQDNYFILWFGISTEKRSLNNQIRIISKLVEELNKYNKVCVVIDGWTTPNSFTPLQSKQAQLDLEVFLKIEKLNPETEFISLVGAKSSQKIAVSTLIDFHVSSGATGSMWPARFGKKEGVFHNSQAYYQVTEKHIRYRGIDYPNSMVQDVVEKVKRIDYVSYNINENEFIEFIVNNYPNIFDNHFDYLRFNIEKTHNLEVINLSKNEFSSLNNDPQFIIDIEKTETALKDSEYTLNLIGYLKFKDSGNHKCNIYLDYGEGFNAGQMVQVIVDSNSEFFEIDIKLEKSLKQLRFDPTSVKTNFVFKGLFYKIVNINNKD